MPSPNAWLLYAFLSALAASLVGIFGRLGVTKLDDNLATTVRSVAMTLMLLASVVAATLLVLIPWEVLLSEVTPLKAAFASLISVFMPVPIALDVMFAAQLQQQGVPAGYVMLFAMTLGTYSIIPSIYLWREVSKPLAVSLFLFF